MPLLARHANPPSNAQLTALLDDVDEVLLLLDARQRLSYCNRAAARLLGCEPGQLAQAALGRVDSDSQARLLEFLQAGRSGGALDLRLDNGPRLPFRLTRSGAGGWVLRGPCQPALSPLPPLGAGATSELVRLMWDTPQPLLVQDTGFVIIAANRAFIDTFDQPVDALIGSDPLYFMAAQDHDGVLQSRCEMLAALQEQRQPELQIERRLIDRQGVQRWFRYCPRWVSADDGSPLLLSVLQDVTLEHRALGQAEHSDHELDQWFDLSPIGMLVYDAAGLVVRCNAAFEALVGHAPVMLRDAPADLARLLAWEGDAPHPDLVVDAGPLEVLSNLVLHDGRRQRLCDPDDGMTR